MQIVAAYVLQIELTDYGYRTRTDPTLRSRNQLRIGTVPKSRDYRSVAMTLNRERPTEPSMRNRARDRNLMNSNRNLRLALIPHLPSFAQLRPKHSENLRFTFTGNKFLSSERAVMSLNRVRQLRLRMFAFTPKDCIVNWITE